MDQLTGKAIDRPVPPERRAQVGPPPVPPPGPIAQSVAIGFRFVYAVALVLCIVWLASNIRQIPSDSQAVVSRFGRIVGAQQAGLLLAWPQPIEQVELLPGPERQLSQTIGTLPPPSTKYAALVGSVLGSASGRAVPEHLGAYLTGDGNVVLLSTNLVYRINDPIAYSLAESHVPAALNRLFRATTVHVTAARKLNDFLVVQTNDVQGGGSGVALRTEVRQRLLRLVNERLTRLSKTGASLGVHVERIDMTAWLPPDAKAAFDAVLVATQAANRAVAKARTDAERRRQAAVRTSQRVVTEAQATAREIMSTAHVRTAPILALEAEATPQTRDSLLLRHYRKQVAEIFNQTGPITVFDPESGARVILPANAPANPRAGMENTASGGSQ